MDYAPAFAGVAVVLVAWFLILPPRSTIQHIPGPQSPSWIFGHMLQLLLPPQYGDYEFAWQKLYGSVYRLKGCFGQDRLIISDPLALQYILNSAHFGHGPTLENAVHLLFDENCLMAATGETHKRYRAAMNVGFTAAAVRNYQPVFERVALTMTDRLEKASLSPMDICPVLSGATLDAISQAIFGYTTQDLGEEFVANNAEIMALSSNQSAVQILADAVGARLPKWVWRAVSHLPTTTFNAIRATKYFANHVGHQIVREKMDALRKGSRIQMDVYDTLLEQGYSDKKRNTLSEQELAAQTGIILVAGQDTTANTLAFGLLELARNPEFQDQLRAEIHSSLGATVLYDSMPLLNAFIKETLRVYPAGPIPEKVALQDTVIPLAEVVTTSNGEIMKQLPVRKGQTIHIATAAYQRLESRWGADAHKFRPSRWIDGIISQGQAVGPYANLLTFLGGPRMCLGWRFAILEMQVFFSELVGKFHFGLPEDVVIGTRYANTLVPTMSNGEKAVPLCITRI
ncbi:cytochrome P450 [Mycena capillaripes]|nr:cytochrome P450 [Mycena capillaripes]